MRQSTRIAFQILRDIPFGSVLNYSIAPKKEKIHFSMESLIQHFRYFSEGFSIDSGECYMFAEAPKGEFGVYVVTFNSTRPYRCKIRTPGFFHLQALMFMGKGLYISDVVTIIGTLDIVFGEVDR
jgi:NADH-quinone oxidoreductase subunit D